MAKVLFSKVNKTGIVELNRPEKLNTIDTSMIRQISQTVDQWVNHPKQIDVLLMKSNSPKAFSAGGDVREMISNGRNNPQIAKDFMFYEYQLDHKLASLAAKNDVHQISFYNGIVMGGGAGVSINSKYRVVTERTIFAMPETTIGFYQGDHVYK